MQTQEANLYAQPLQTMILTLYLFKTIQQAKSNQYPLAQFLQLQRQTQLMDLGTGSIPLQSHQLLYAQTLERQHSQSELTHYSE